MKDRLLKFILSATHPQAPGFTPIVTSIDGFTDAVIEANGSFIESKAYLRSYVISIYANPNQPGVIHSVSSADPHPLHKLRPELIITM